MAALVAALLAMLGSPRYHHRVEVAAAVIHEAAELEGLDADEEMHLAAVAVHESRLTLHIFSAPHGPNHVRDTGLVQINPEGMQRTLCRGLNWRRRPVDNARCGARILLAARNRCGIGWAAGLSGFNGRPCRASRYSRRVLALVARGRRAAGIAVAGLTSQSLLIP